uniref:alpha/beta fold hydrolase n=1 Tax=Nonomuraea gerenzanensis TaxID=93944 RepID=UPI001CD95EBD|nr:alpha/beta hydrolase [Nonomuraea gerenzanensis]UBU18489.1 alpha/beta hydrolase [Nonomuraea gerenzanensis]
MDSRLWDAVVPERAVLDHFGLPQAALVGLSMGGETALDSVLALPTRVTAVALVGAPVSGHSWPADTESTVYATARRRGRRQRLWPSWSCRSGRPWDVPLPSARRLVPGQLAARSPSGRRRRAGSVRGAGLQRPTGW